MTDTTGQGGSAPDDAARPRVTGPAVLGVLLCVLPMAVVALSPLRAETALVYIGLLPAFVSLTLGSQVATATAVATATVMFVGLLSSGSPVVGALLLTVLGLGVAWAHTRGWQLAATYVATQAALAVVAAPQVGFLDAAEHPAGSLANASLVALVVLVSGLWVAGVGHLLLRGIARVPEPRPWGPDLQIFGVTLAVLLGVSTLVIMRRTDGGNAWWILLTILVSLTPTASDTVSRALQRAGGTIVGGALAAALIVVVADGGVLIRVGALAALATAAAFVKAPYWVFAMMLTMALVLVTFPVGHALRRPRTRRLHRARGGAGARGDRVGQPPDRPDAATLGPFPRAGRGVRAAVVGKTARVKTHDRSQGERRTRRSRGCLLGLYDSCGRPQCYRANECGARCARTIGRGSGDGWRHRGAGLGNCPVTRAQPVLADWLKTDARDAVRLARLLRLDEVTVLTTTGAFVGFMTSWHSPGSSADQGPVTKVANGCVDSSSHLVDDFVVLPGAGLGASCGCLASALGRT